MISNAIEKLKTGEFEFIGLLSIYQVNDIIKEIRKNPNKNKIISAFIKQALNIYPGFCFNLIYDNDKYQDEILYLINNYYSRINLNSEKLKSILTKTNLGKKIILTNFEKLSLETNEQMLNEIINYTFENYESTKEIITKLAFNQNMTIRFIFMKYIIENYPAKLKEIYDDITKYFKNENNEKLSQEKVSIITTSLLNSSNDKETYQKMKNYLLTNYSKNDLAKNLVQTKKGIKELTKNSKEYFDTSATYQFEIYKNYSKHIKEEIIQDFHNYIKHFTHYNQFDKRLARIFENGLGDKLKLYIDKYLSLSQDKTISFLKEGTTASCYQIGNYVFKLIKTKWSFEEEICPNLYLILKNEEEDYIRDKKGIVLAGLEVQKLLTKTTENLSKEDVKAFDKNLESLGYYCTDSYINGTFGDNCMLLDSYKDADCENPENLPENFKQTPLVLVDRDRVYKLNNKKPKQLKPY